MLFSEYLDNRVKGREKGLPIFFYDKEKTFQYCKLNEIRTVEKIQMFDNTNDLVRWFESAPEEFVIKPSFLSSMIGVMVLTRQPDGTYFEGLTRKHLKKEDILQSQIKFFDNSSKAEKHIVIEEKINDKYVDGIPLDYKVYIFYDQIAVIGVFNRNSSKLYVDWYDENLLPLEKGLLVNQEPYTYTSEVPLVISKADREAIINFAIKTSKKIKLPFVSLDLYLSNNGPILGEVTLAPGGLYYQKMYKVADELQVKLGKMWEVAITSISE